MRKLRNRDVAHFWVDINVMRWLQNTFTGTTLRNIQCVYWGMCQMSTNFKQDNIYGFNSTLHKYSGLSKNTITPIVYFLEEVGLVKIRQHTVNGRFSHSRLSMYEWTDQDKLFNSNKEYLVDILEGREKRRKGKTTLTQKYVNAKLIRFKNTKVSLSKNDTKVSSNNSSKEEYVAKPRTYFKPIKRNGTKVNGTKVNPDSLKSKPKSDVDVNSLNSDPINAQTGSQIRIKAHNYDADDYQVYNELLLLGSTNHNEEKNSYYKTMNMIHELLHPEEFRNPYCHISKIPDDYKIKEWTIDEILETFQYYMSIASDRPMYKNFATFVVAQQAGGTKSWSPLVKFNIDLQKNKGETLDGEEKILMKGLNKLGLGEVEASGVKKITTLMGVYSKDYRVSQQLNHIYYGEIAYVFLDYVKEKNRDLNFRPYYMLSERFIKQFFDDSKRSKYIVKRNLNAGY